MAFSGVVYDASGTVDSGGVSQVALAAGGRKFLLIQNPITESEALWVNLTGDATVGGETGSISLAPGGALSFEGDFVPSNAVRVTATTTEHVYTINWG